MIDPFISRSRWNLKKDYRDETWEKFLVNLAATIGGIAVQEGRKE